MRLKPDERVYTVTLCESLHVVVLMLPDPLHEIRCHPDIKRAIVPIYRDSQECTRRAASSLGHSTIFGSEHRKPSADPTHRDRRGPGDEIHRLSDFANLLDSGFRRNDGDVCEEW